MKILVAKLGLLFVCLFVVVSLQAAISKPLDFETEAQEQQYQKLVRELRCTVCQSESIYESNSALAADVRRRVYEMALAGKTEAETINFMVERYGDYVRYRPAFQANTLALWFSPFVLLLLGVGIWWQVVGRRKNINKVVELSAEDRQSLARVRKEG